MCSVKIAFARYSERIKVFSILFILLVLYILLLLFPLSSLLSSFRRNAAIPEGGGMRCSRVRQYFFKCHNDYSRELSKRPLLHIHTALEQPTGLQSLFLRGQVAQTQFSSSALPVLKTGPICSTCQFMLNFL